MNGQIERDRWKDYLTEFGRSNELRPARLEILSDEFGANEKAQHLPLIGISYEEKGSDAGDVLITLGGANAEDGRHVTHTIRAATAVAARDGDDGRADALEIIGADGEKAILAFEQPLQIEAETSSAAGG